MWTLRWRVATWSLRAVSPWMSWALVTAAPWTKPLFIFFQDIKGNNYARFDRDSMRRALREHRLAHCRVPIRQGTLLVFSNCQVAHRVLRMANSKPQEARHGHGIAMA